MQTGRIAETDLPADEPGTDGPITDGSAVPDEPWDDQAWEDQLPDYEDVILRSVN